MLILTNGLTDVIDEGFLKVANSLVRRLKNKMDEKAYIITYERKSDISDEHITLNKLFLNKKLLSCIHKRNEKVLYVPFPSKTIAMAIRTFVLSLFAKKGLSVILVQKSEINFIAKCLLKLSKADIVVFSKESFDFFCNIVQERRVNYIKTGIDIEKFSPASLGRVVQLRKKYGLDVERPVVLHVGHLKKGRNIEEIIKLSQKYQVVLVVSTLFKEDIDKKLYERIVTTDNIKLIDYYLPDIQEIYQLADVYFFPVTEKGNCIDVPLSCMEAAACNKPIVTTAYGEMKAFNNKDGFLFIDSFDEDDISSLIETALNIKNCDIRSNVIEYDWNNAVERLM